MTGPFGDGPVELVRDAGPSVSSARSGELRSAASARSGELRSAARRDMDLCTEALAGLADAATVGRLRVHRPARTAAFSRRDSLSPGYPAAERAARAHGYEPVVRPAGGRLAAYHPGAVVVDLVGRHPEPRVGIRARFALFGELLAAELRTLGVPAGVGAVPGEYCPGEFSVHAGPAKIAGTAQRLTRHGYLFSAVLLVTDPEPVRAVLVDAYAALGLGWSPATVGCLADHVPGITVDTAEDAVLAAVDRLLTVTLNEEERWAPLSTSTPT